MTNAKQYLFNGKLGFTVVELMVTIVVVMVLSASVGVFFAKLLQFQENEREEAYVREKLTDICGAYADAMSVGAGIVTYTNLLDKTQGIIVKYRQETGGVSLETGIVTRVVYLASSLNPTNKVVNLDVFGISSGNLDLKLSRHAQGDAALLPLVGDMMSCTITPLGTMSSLPNCESVGEYDAENCSKMVPNSVFQNVDVGLGWLEVKARYKAKNDDVPKTVTAGRVVRLWNKE